jgi:hypothetical protein
MTKVHSADSVKERPIIYTAESVRAILEGRKTQTRRVINPQPEYQGKKSFGDAWKWSKGKDWFAGVTTEQLVGKFGLLHDSRSTHGVPGDRLWVREAWCPVDEGEEGGWVDWDPQSEVEDGYGEPECILYKTDDVHGFTFRSPRFMPRWASRILLDLVQLRVERVQDITAKDCLAEGVRYPVRALEGGKVRPMICVSDQSLMPHILKIKNKMTHENLLIAHFAGMWDSINAKRDGGKYAWEKNPWVWVLETRRIDDSH